MSNESVLIVGRDLASGDVVEPLTDDGWSVGVVSNLEEAQEELERKTYEVVVVDVAAAGNPPWRSLEALRSTDAAAALLLVVPPESPWSLSEGRHLRPAGLLVKPVEKSALVMTIDSARVYRRLLAENQALKRQLSKAVNVHEWIGCSRESREVRQSITTAALATVPVLLLGEDGSGRRLAAELIHRHGRNSGGAFLPIELNRLPKGQFPALLEELSSAQTSGFFAAHAAGSPRLGTLFLSEITVLAPSDQEALLLFARGASFRLIVSAHPSLDESVRIGRFHRALFEFLSQLTIEIPPLRERPDDLPVLVDHFLRKFSARLGLRPLGIPATVLESYSTYDWPGNVDELSMVVERAVSYASAAKLEGTTIPERACALPSVTALDRHRLHHISLKEVMADIEKRIILETLARVDGSQKKAAEQLHLNATTLHEKMKRYKILPEKSRSASA